MWQPGAEFLSGQPAGAGFRRELKFGEDKFLGGFRTHLVHVEQQRQDSWSDQRQQAGDTGGSQNAGQEIGGQHTADQAPAQVEDPAAAPQIQRLLALAVSNGRSEGGLVGAEACAGGTVLAGEHLRPQYSEIVRGYRCRVGGCGEAGLEVVL